MMRRNVLRRQPSRHVAHEAGRHHGIPMFGRRRGSLIRHPCRTRCRRRARLRRSRSWRGPLWPEVRPADPQARGVPRSSSAAPTCRGEFSSPAAEETSAGVPASPVFSVVSPVRCRTAFLADSTVDSTFSGRKYHAAPPRQHRTRTHAASLRNERDDEAMGEALRLVRKAPGQLRILQIYTRLILAYSSVPVKCAPRLPDIRNIAILHEVFP